MEEDNKIIDKRPKIIDDIGLFSEDKETANAPITSPQEELQRDFSQQTTLKTPPNYNPTYITTGDLSLVKPEVQIPRPKIIDDIGLLDEEGKDTQGSAGSGVVGTIKNIANEAYDVVRNANWASLLPSAETPPDIKDENNAINPYLKKHPYLYGVLSNSYEYSKLPAELTATILGATAGMAWASVLTGAGAYAGVNSRERVANNWMYGDKLPETLPEAAAETALNFALGTLGVSPNKPKHLIEGMFSPEELKAKGFEMPLKGALGHVENFVRSMFGASKRFEERDKRNIEALQNSINEYIKNPSQDSVGTKIKNSIENIFKSKDIEDKKLIEKEYRDIMTELKMGGESSTTNYLRDLKKAKESLVKNKDKSWKEVTEAYNRSKALIPDSLRSEAER